MNLLDRLIEKARSADTKKVVSLPAGLRPESGLGLRIVKPSQEMTMARGLTLGAIREYGMPHRGLPGEINDWRRANRRNLLDRVWKPLLASKLGLPHFQTRMYLTKITADGHRVPLGLASLRVVTDVGVGFIVDAWQNSVELEIMKYHGIGTGTTAADQTDTDIETELTTQYTSDNTRATGSLTEGASANIFRTVGTNPVDASVAITEHGILSNATVGSGVLFDRHVFAAINLSSGDSLESTYDATLPANG